MRTPTPFPTTTPRTASALENSFQGSVVAKRFLTRTYLKVYTLYLKPRTMTYPISGALLPQPQRKGSCKTWYRAPQTYLKIMLAFRGPLHECGNLITAAVLVAIFSMAQLVSEGSEEETSETSTSSRAHSRVLKTWQPWRPGSYFLVFLVNATATACLFPRNFEFTHLYEFVPILEVSVCPLSDKISFSGLMLASVGAGCVAAFLQKRARASTHAHWGCGYATINWFQSLFGSLTLLVIGFERHLCDSCQYRFRCKYGLLPGDRMDKSVFHAAFVFCRVVLYLIGLFWMQMLLAKRLDILEQTSHQKYCSRCFRRLIWLQSLGVTVGVLWFSSFALAILTLRSWRS